MSGNVGSDGGLMVEVGPENSAGEGFRTLRIPVHEPTLVERLAEQADEGDVEAMFTDTEAWLNRFTALVMEECAKVADEEAESAAAVVRDKYAGVHSRNNAFERAQTLEDLAAAIRAAKPKG